MQALWMVLASLIFSIMSVCVKFAAVHFSTFELVFYRGAIGTLLMAYVCQRKGISLLTRVPKMHTWRAFTGVVSLAAWFYAIAYLPLATAMTLNYMSGIWVADFLHSGDVVRIEMKGRDGLGVFGAIAQDVIPLASIA